MVQSDALSRWPDLCPDEDNDNEYIIMLPDNMFLNLIDTNLQEKIATSNDFDGNATEALKLLLEKGPTTMTAGLDDWKIETSNGRKILFYKGKNYIPRNTELQRELVKLFHDHETAGHPGEIGTYNAVCQHYWCLDFAHL
jgi:Integrase zinc binding domain